MNFEEITLQNYDWATEYILSFEVQPTDSLIEQADEIRKRHKFMDLAKDSDNNVWYNFYLEVNFRENSIVLWFSCNNGEKDDYAQYKIHLDTDEANLLLWEAFAQYTKEAE